MPSNEQYEADILIGGKIDESLSRSLGMSLQELQRYSREISDIQRLSQKINLGINGIDAGKIRESTQQMSSFKASLNEITAIASGVGIGTMLTQGFDLAIAKAQEFAGFLKDAVKQAANFQTNKAQLQIETGDNPAQLKELMDQLQWGANKSPFHMPELAEDIRKLMSMGFNDQKQAREFLHSEMNIAAATKRPNESYDAHLNQLNEAFSKAIAQGHIMERNLYMLEDSGVKIRPWLEQKLGMPIGTMGDLQSDESLNQIRSAVKKGQLNSSMLLGFAREQTAPGAKYSDEAVAPMIRNYFGATSTLGDTIQQFERGIGVR